MVVGQRQEGVRGREKSKEKLVILGIEKKGKGVSRMYARVIERASEKELKPFFEDHIDQNANIRTDGWRSYAALKSKYPNLKQELSGKKGDNFSDIHRCIMMLKSWLRGVRTEKDQQRIIKHKLCSVMKIRNEIEFEFPKLPKISWWKFTLFIVSIILAFKVEPKEAYELLVKLYEELKGVWKP
jgi:hypothetical protein